MFSTYFEGRANWRFFVTGRRGENLNLQSRRKRMWGKSHIGGRGAIKFVLFIKFNFISLRSTDSTWWTGYAARTKAMTTRYTIYLSENIWERSYRRKWHTVFGVQYTFFCESSCFRRNWTRTRARPGVFTPRTDLRTGRLYSARTDQKRNALRNRDGSQCWECLLTL